MLNFLSGISLFLMSLLAYAADQPGAVVDTSVSESALIGIIIFGILFFGVIVGYFGYLYWSKKESQDGDKTQKIAR